MSVGSAWIDPPLAGRNGLSRSSPQLQLPKIVQRAVTPSSASQGNFKDFLPSSSRRSKENDRGMTAAAWSRKLPCGVPSQALRSVRTHLSPVEDAMFCRHTTNLDNALKEASNGNKYLKTVSVVRRSRSVPAMQRHALEAALATHLIRAKVELDKWHAGITEINQLRKVRNPEKLRATLASWQFAEDDPVVVNARDDLARWRYIEEQMPGILKKAVEDKDVETIRDSIKQLLISGPSDVKGSREARDMLRRYDSQAKAIKEAVSARNVEGINTALANWEFPEDEHVEEARATLERREEQLRHLKIVVACERVHGQQLVAGVTTWEFERDNEDFSHAVEVLTAFRMESRALEEIIRQDPVNLMQLRIAMDSWSFATDPDSCTALQVALTLLTNYEEEVKAALANSDGFALRELLNAGSGGQALGNEELIAQANALQNKHETASNSLLELVRTAPNLEANAKDGIAEKCKNWTFAETDPVFELGRSWLRLHSFAADCSAKELEDVARGRFEGPMRGAMSRQQGLPKDTRASAAVQDVFGAIGKVWQAAGTLALGAPTTADGQTGMVDAMMRELKVAETARQNCSMEAIREVKSLAHPPEAVHCFLQVFQALLAGSSNWRPMKEDTSWRACHDMMIDTRKFVDHLGEVPVFIGTGRRTGVINARTLDARMRAGPHAAEWSSEGMGQLSAVCEHLFVYMESIFRYDALVSANLAPARERTAGKPSFDVAWRALQESLKDLGGLPDSGQLGVLLLTSGGQVAELEGCEARAASLLEAMRARMLKLQSALEDVSPFDQGLANDAGAESGSAVLTLAVQMASGEVLGKVQISEQATGMQLKELIASQSEFEAPSASEQRLMNGAVTVQDHTSLARQAVQHGTVLTCVRVEASLLHRLTFLSSTIRALDSSALAGPEAKYLVKAASYFVFEGSPSKKSDAPLRILNEFLKDASAFVHHSTIGKMPQKTCITVCERRIQARMFEWADLPVYQFTVVLYYLRRYVSASEGDNAIVFSEFIAVLRKLYDEFLPLYLSWAAASRGVAEAEDACHSARKVATLGQQLLADKRKAVFSLEPDAVIEQLEALGGSGFVVAAPHVEALSKAAARDVASLLESADIKSPGLRAKHIEKILVSHLSPVIRVTEVLGRLAKKLTAPGGMPHEIAHFVPIYQLMVAVFRILRNPSEPDIEFAEAKRHCGQPKLLTKLLATWQPWDASVEQLRHAQTLLVKLWSLFRTGVLHPNAAHDERHRILFAWAALATSLAPLLSAALELAPVYAAVREAADGMKRPRRRSSAAEAEEDAETLAAEAEEAAWLQVRQALHRPEEPWWWLRLIGSTDPKGFYVDNGLCVDTSADLPDEQQAAEAADKRRAAEAAETPMGVSTGVAATASAQKENSPAGADYSFAQSGGANEDSYTFDQEGEQEGDPGPVTPSQQLDRDGYSPNFEDSKGLSPNGGAYSQDGFEMDNERSPTQPEARGGATDYEADADFEETDEGIVAADAGPRYSTDGFEFEADEAPGSAAGSAAGVKAKESKNSEFEADDGFQRTESKYSNGEFEEDSPTAAGAQGAGDGNYNTDFEADDDFEPDD